MGVVYVEELWDGRGGEDGIERKRKYTRRFEVRTDTYADDATTVGNSPLLPRNGQRHPMDAYALLVKIRPEGTADDPTLWTVSCDYDTEIPRAQARESQKIDPDTGQSKESGQDPQTRPENPLDRPATYKVSHEQTSEVVEDDNAGSPILNSADDPFDPPLEEERSYAVVTVSKNYAVVEFDWLELFVDSINSTRWRGRAPFTCRMIAIEYEPAQENNVSFWKVQFRIKIRKQLWLKKVIDRGFREKIPTGPGTFKWERITDPGTGAFPTEPQLLDGNGRKLTAGSGPVFRTFHTKPEKSFNQLGI